MGTLHAGNQLVSHQLLMLEGDPMKMRLRPPFIKDVAGNKIQDGKRRRWYAHFKHKGKNVGTCLDAEEYQDKKATVNLGKLFEQLERGIVPGGLRKKIKFLNPRKEFSSDFKGICKNHIKPFFGEFQPHELKLEHMEKYLEEKWGRNEDGHLQAMESRLRKHIQVLGQLIHSVDKNFDMSSKGDLLMHLKYDSQTMDLLPPLNCRQIEEVGVFADKNKEWAKFFWIMAFTGIEAADVIDLRQKHFQVKKGWLVKPRHKNMLKKKKTMISVPILPKLQEILDKVPTPLDKNAPLFPKMRTDTMNKVIGKMFVAAGYKGYGSKYLRRYIGGLLKELNYGDEVIGRALAHCDNSTETIKYTAVSDGVMAEAFDKIAQRF